MDFSKPVKIRNIRLPRTTILPFQIGTKQNEAPQVITTSAQSGEHPETGLQS